VTYDLAAERRKVRIGRKNKIIEVSKVRAWFEHGKRPL
jgi:hypothetical protein